MKDRRILPRVAAPAVATAMALGLTACGGDGTGSSASSGLTVWYGPGSVPKASLAVQKQFPGLKIKLIPTPNLETKLKTTLQTGSGLPDVVVIGNDISSYSSIEKKFVDLKSLGADPTKDYVTWKWANGTTPSGRVIGFPIDTGPQGLFYRQDLFAKAGLPTDPDAVSKLAATWKGFTTVAEKAKKAGFKVCDNANQVFFTQLEQKGQGSFTASGEYVGDSAVTRTAFYYTAKLLSSGMCTKASPYETDWNSSVAQNALGAFVGPVYEGPLLKTAGAKEGVWRVAFPPGGAGSKGGSYMAILSSSKHQKDAYKVVKWMMSPANQAAGFETDGLFPSALAAYKSPEVTAAQPFYGGQATGAVFAKVAEESPTIPVTPQDGIVEGALTGGLQSVAQGKASVDEAWKTAQAQIKKQLKR
ncbi:extracellular solute-binding protein [Streptomyces shenzhenensis]|uniref:extracellular solute-binding protein n=1 Tax=Streptomyces shenzhenensis TaxID=943815 RepID=UPI0015F0A3E6|nr:extracellular solute-binding protein [Streptomyces shenzhenensis]